MADDEVRLNDAILSVRAFICDAHDFFNFTHPENIYTNSGAD